jgi:hypothetical protein
LHKATVTDWQEADYADKLATTADWVMIIPEIKTEVLLSGINKARPYAIELIACVNEVAAGQGYEDMRISELAAACIMLMGWTE